MSQSYKLRDGWTLSTIGEIADYVQRGRAYSYVGSGDVAIVNQRCIRWDGIDFQHLKYTTSTKRQIDARRVLRDGDVLWNSTGTGTLGRAAVFTGSDPTKTFVADGHVSVIRCSPVILPDFLYYFIRSPFVQDRLVELQTGSTGQVGLNLSTILRLEIPLPPVSEQRRITDALTTILERLDQTAFDIEASQALLKRSLSALSLSAFDGRLTQDWREKSAAKDAATQWQATPINSKSAQMLSVTAPPSNDKDPFQDRTEVDLRNIPREWTITQLGNLSAEERPIRYGILQPGPNLAGGSPYVRVVDIKEGAINTTALRRTSPGISKKYARSRLSAGDIVLSIRGTVGKSAKVPQELDGANITQDSVRISLAPHTSSSFILWYLRSSPAMTYMRVNQKGIAVRGINVRDVRAMEVPVPPRAEQEEIARKLDYASDWAARVAAEQVAAKKATDRLRTASIRRAIQGGLVPQNPKDIHARASLDAALAARLDNAKAEPLPHIVRVKDNSIRSGKDKVPKYDLIAALTEHPDGLPPYDLLVVSGYSLDEIELFYDSLSSHVTRGEIKETRPTVSSVLLSVPHANR